MNALLARLGPDTVRVLALLAVLAAVVLFFASQIEHYLNARLFNRISTSVAIIAIVAVGQAVVVMTRNIDLSVGSIVGCVAYFLGGIVAAYPSIPPVLVPVLAMAIGAAFGAVNGLLVSRLKLPAIIVTLATLAIFRSILVEYSDGASITTASLPPWLVEFARLDALAIGDLRVRWTVVIALAVVVLAHLFLTRLRAGRRFYAVGSNPDAAEFAGIDVAGTVMRAFLISGALSGLAAFVFLSRFGNITVVAGLGFELKAVGAVVVGGVNIFGGSGTVIGVLLGAILIDLLDTSLVRWALVTEFWRDAVLGCLILLAVALNTAMSRRLVARRADEAPARAAAGDGGRPERPPPQRAAARRSPPPGGPS